MTEEKSPERHEAPQTPAEKPPKSGPKVDMITIFVVIAVIALLIIAVVSYSMFVSEDEESGLVAEVTPDNVDIEAGDSIDLAANASWNGELVDDSPGTAYSWSVSNASLGSLSTLSGRLTTFTAGQAEGTGVIFCNVTFAAENETAYSNLTIDLTVSAPVLESVSITPGTAVMVYDRVVLFNATAVSNFGILLDANFTWVLEGIPSANYTLNSTQGWTVNLTANITGTCWLNVTAEYGSVNATASAEITVIEAAPTTTVTASAMPAGAGVNFTCAEPAGALSWDEVIVYLTDGTDTVNWTLTMGGLNGGSFNMTEFGPRTIGSFTVFLNVTDVSGNGTVNATDYFTFTASGGKFNPARDYIVSWVYVPTGDLIVQSTFRG